MDTSESPLAKTLRELQEGPALVIAAFEASRAHVTIGEQVKRLLGEQKPTFATAFAESLRTAFETRNRLAHIVDAPVAKRQQVAPKLPVPAAPKSVPQPMTALEIAEYVDRHWADFAAKSGPSHHLEL